MPKVLIEHCIPLEPCVDSTRYEHHGASIAAGSTLEPVKGVALDDGCYLITNGSHRCKAACDAGLDEVCLEIDDRKTSSFVTSPHDMVEWRRHQGYQGFKSLPIVSPDEHEQSPRTDERDMKSYFFLKEVERKTLERNKS